MRTLSTAIVGALVLSTAIAYRKYMQCDSRWAHDKLDLQQSTLCSDNGLVTAAAMMIAGKTTDFTNRPAKITRIRP